MTIPFDEQWPGAKFGGDYRAFLLSMTKKERLAWRHKTDHERGLTMAKPATRRGRPAKVNSQAEQLQTALSFVAAATGDIQDYQEYVNLGEQMAICFNGQVAAGHPIVEELTLCPHLERLQKALARCGKSLQIGETPSGQLSVKGDKLRALVPCVRAEDMPHVAPDAPVCTLDDRIKEAFRVCGTLASENGERVVEASLLLEAKSCIGTNGVAMLQYWHGVDLPPHIVVPKVFAAAVCKVAKPITGFGFSWSSQPNANGEWQVSSLTIWFDGGAWIKTQCYKDRWPDIGYILNVDSFPVELPSGLFEGVEAVTHFNDDGHVTFAEGKVMSHNSDGVGAQYEVPGLPGGKTFNGKLIKQVSPWVSKIDLTTYNDKAYFFGGTDENPVRGAIMGMRALVTEIDTANYEPGQSEIDADNGSDDDGE